MKKFLLTICTMTIGIIVGAAYAETFTITWLNEDKTTTYDTTTCTAGTDIILPTAPTKRGYTFMGWRGYYIPIEYLESTGTQYIDTGFKPNQNTRVVMEYMISSCNVSNGFLFGARIANGSSDQFGCLYASNNMLRFDTGSQLFCTDVTSAFYNNKLNLNMVTPNNLTITNTATGAQLANCTNNSNNSQSNYTLFLFGANDGGNVSTAKCSFKIYSFRLYNNDTLVRNMIPVLDFNDVPCMYDRVSGQFFYNAGTGDFIAGPVISE